jgi:hypothetical protein|tara:strand:- start:26 stop:400 length:375 start_codon:yes stop_codon:yes gene_type:complete
MPEEITVENPEQIKFPAYDTSTFELKVMGMKTKTVGETDNVVSWIDYVVVAVLADGTRKRYAGEVTYLDESLEAAESFVPYADLTETQVKSWIEAYAPIESIKRSLTSPEGDDALGATSEDLPW